jgi:hypothetical protein
MDINVAKKTRQKEKNTLGIQKRCDRSTSEFHQGEPPSTPFIQTTNQYSAAPPLLNELILNCADLFCMYLNTHPDVESSSRIGHG